MKKRTPRRHRFSLSSSILRKTVFRFARRPARHETVANPRRLSRVDAVAAPRHRVDAIDATALSRTRRDGPDVLQRLDIEKETTHDLV